MFYLGEEDRDVRFVLHQANQLLILTKQVLDMLTLQAPFVSLKISPVCIVDSYSVCAVKKNLRCVKEALIEHFA